MILIYQMASRVDVLLCALVVIAIFSINKDQFVGSDSIGIMINDPSVIQGKRLCTVTKGMKLFHQNICGLAAKISHIEHILMNFKDIHMFTLSETHLNEENSPLLADISGFKLAYRNRPNGTYGGVAAFISDRVQWIRRHDLEHTELECLWIEVLINNAKVY